MHISLSLHTKQLVPINHILLVEQVRVSQTSLLMIDVDEIWSHLSYLSHIGQQLQHCAITPHFHVDILRFLTSFVGVDSD
jgi:hypothetical protein